MKFSKNMTRGFLRNGKEKNRSLSFYYDKEIASLKKVAKRRAKNKVAKQSRKVNR
jgi:hypothetical protein